MKKYTSQEAFYNRMNKLADVKKPSINENGTRNLGTLIDIERAANGVAYGIVKEQHRYYIKKGGLNENQTVADFAYIGGLGNVTEFEYTKLSEAQKNRNMLLKNVNEGITTKVNPSGSKTVPKKTMLTEDKAGQEIDSAESKLGDLDAATAAAEVPAEPAMPEPEGGAEMDAGLDAMDAPADEMGADPLAGGEEMGAGMEDMGADPLAGGDEMPAEDPLAGGDEMGADPLAADDGMGSDSGEEVAVEDPETEIEREIEKSLGKITNQLRKTELTDSQVKSYVNTFLSAFKDKFPDIDIEDRKAMAEKITKVVPPEDIEDLGQNVEDTETSDEIVPTEEPEMAEQQCAECGGFAQYAESRGYNAESIKECGEEEMTNMVSGYANAHGEGHNDGDFKAVALFITPEIIEKLRGEYGHDDFANQVEPFSQEMNEASAEDRDAQINELFGSFGAGLKGAARSIGRGVGGAIDKGVERVKSAASDVKQGVQQAATNVKQGYHRGALSAEMKKANELGNQFASQIKALNDRLKKANQEELDMGSLLSSIKNQMVGSGGVNIAGTKAGKTVRTNEEGIPVDSTEVFPPAEPALEEDVTLKVGEKAGKPLSPKNVPQVEMKEAEEKEGEDIDIENLDVDAEESGDDDVLDLTKRKEPEMNMGTGFENMGGAFVKPDGAETTTVEVTKDSVNVTMNESEEDKVRKYIRKKLEEHAGIRKPSLNESVKSEGLKKLDRVIAKQFELFESVTLEASEELNEILGFSIKEKFAKIDPNNPKEVGKLFYETFRDILNNPQMGAIYNAAKKTPNAIRYNILKQFVEQGGGTLRTGRDTEGVVFAPKTVKNAAVKSAFSQGGTQGKTQLGGV